MSSDAYRAITAVMVAEMILDAHHYSSGPVDHIEVVADLWELLAERGELDRQPAVTT